MFLFFWVALAAIGALIGRRKRRALAGFIYSLILGPFGWLAIALADGRGKQCSSCGSWVDEQAPVCPKCLPLTSQPSQEQPGEPSAEAVVDNHPKPKDKNRSIEWARDAMARPHNWVLWDTETTGNGRTAEIVQIGVLAPDGSVLLDTFVRPLNRKRIPADATAIHGITMKMLVDAPSYPELAPALIEALKGKTVIAYNAQFERRLIRQTAERNGGPVLEMSWNCAMLEYARFVGQWMAYKGEYKWQKLPSAEHGAVADCRATLQLLKMMASTPYSVVPRRRWRL